MPSTYSQIANTTVSGSSTSTVSFGSISGSYTDLILVCVGNTSADGIGLRFRVNSDTGSNYSLTAVYGDGTSAGSFRTSSQTSLAFTTWYTGANISNFILHLQNYSNTTTNKTMVARENRPNTLTTAQVGLWRSTAAINAISIDTATGTFTAGSTFALYGIKAA